MGTSLRWNTIFDLRENEYVFYECWSVEPAVTRILTFTSIGNYVKKIFQTLSDGSIHGALHFHISFDDLDTFSK